MSATPRPWGFHTHHHGAADICDYVITAGERGEKEVLRVDGRNLNISDFMLIIQAVSVREELVEAAKAAHHYIAVGDFSISTLEVLDRLVKAIEKAETS